MMMMGWMWMSLNIPLLLGCETLLLALVLPSALSHNTVLIVCTPCCMHICSLCRCLPEPLLLALLSLLNAAFDSRPLFMLVFETRQNPGKPRISKTLEFIALPAHTVYLALAIIKPQDLLGLSEGGFLQLSARLSFCSAVSATAALSESLAMTDPASPKPTKTLSPKDEYTPDVAERSVADPLFDEAKKAENDGFETQTIREQPPATEVRLVTPHDSFQISLAT